MNKSVRQYYWKIKNLALWTEIFQQIPFPADYSFFSDMTFSFIFNVEMIYLVAWIWIWPSDKTEF